MCCVIQALFSKADNVHKRSVIYSHVDGEERADHGGSPPVASASEQGQSSPMNQAVGRQDSLLGHGPVLRMFGVVRAVPFYLDIGVALFVLSALFILHCIVLFRGESAARVGLGVCGGAGGVGTSMVVSLGSSRCVPRKDWLEFANGSFARRRGRLRLAAREMRLGAIVAGLSEPRVKMPSGGPAAHRGFVHFVASGELTAQ